MKLIKKRTKSIIMIVLCMFFFSGCSADKHKSSSPVTNQTELVEDTFAHITSSEEVSTELATPLETSTEPEEELATEPPYEPVSLAFTGDVFFSDILYGYYQKDGVAGFLSENVRKNLTEADLYIADHEFVCSDRGEIAEYQIYTFRAPAAREKIFKEMGADIVTLANNHSLDYGVTALQDTFALLNQLDIDYVGAGNNLAESLKPSIREINGKKIAVFGASRFVPQTFWYSTENNPGLLTTYETTDRYPMILSAIEEAKKECDYVVMFVHFGEEKKHTVEEYQKVVAHGYIDAGADLVVACHPHVLQGIEYYKGKPIMYSLGNFLFSNYHSDTMVFNVTINEDNSSNVNILPCSSEMYKTTDITGAAARNLFDFMERISFGISIDDNGNVTPKEEMKSP